MGSSAKESLKTNRQLVNVTTKSAVSVWAECEVGYIMNFKCSDIDGKGKLQRHSIADIDLSSSKGVVLASCRQFDKLHEQLRVQSRLHLDHQRSDLRSPDQHR